MIYFMVVVIALLMIFLLGLKHDLKNERGKKEVMTFSYETLNSEAFWESDRVMRWKMENGKKL